MLTLNTQFEATLRRLIEARIETIKEELISAHRSVTPEEYKFRVGHVHGLRDALEMCEEAQGELNKR